MTLSLEAGRLDYRNALHEISQADLVDWQAYESLNGLGPTRDDTRAEIQTRWLLASKGVDPDEMQFDVYDQVRELEKVDPLMLLAAAFGCPPPMR